MKHWFKRFLAGTMTVSMLAGMTMLSSAEMTTVNLNDTFSQVEWKFASTPDNKGLEGDNMVLKTTANGGALAFYEDRDAVWGDMKLRFNLQINRNPGWTAILFRIVGDVPDDHPVAFYDGQLDKYAVNINSEGTMNIAAWKKGNTQQYDLSPGVPGLFDDGEPHLVEIEVENQGDNVYIAVYVDNVFQVDALDEGDPDLHGGAPITSPGRIAIHTFQSTASPLGPDIVLSPPPAEQPHVTTTAPPTTTEDTSSEPTTPYDPASEAPTEPDDTTTTRTAPTTAATTPTTGADDTDTDADGDNGWIVWVVIAAVVVLAGVGAAVYFLVIRKKKTPQA